MTSAGLNTTDSLRQTPTLTATILLVDDEAAVREVTRAVLEMGGYRVLEADGPTRAKHIAGDQSMAIDLLLTDVVMPGMSGLELARLVRMSRPELITLFMSGYGEDAVLSPASAGMAEKHIQKPFTVQGLLARVAGALEARWRVRDHK